MSDLIDRKKLLEDVENAVSSVFGEYAGEAALEEIRYANSVDAVRVVRCCDCKHAHLLYGESGALSGLSCEILNRAVDFVDYCSHGERK